jgi:hypothetical protein
MVQDPRYQGRWPRLGQLLIQDQLQSANVEFSSFMTDQNLHGIPLFANVLLEDTALSYCASI